MRNSVPAVFHLFDAHQKSCMRSRLPCRFLSNQERKRLAMSYKTVLVRVDESSRAEERIGIAAGIALAESAHLVGTAASGASPLLLQASTLPEFDVNLPAHLDLLRQRAERGLKTFENAAQSLGVASFETRLVDDEANTGICLQARYADLVVIGQDDPNEPAPLVPH
jgi:nucleotide-binding universal stress UspA family protein